MSEEEYNRAKPLIAPRRRIRHLLDRKDLETDEELGFHEVRDMLTDLDPDTEVEIVHGKRKPETYRDKSPIEVRRFIAGEYHPSREAIHGWHQSYVGEEDTVHYVNLAAVRVKQKMGDDVRLGRLFEKSLISYTE